MSRTALLLVDLQNDFLVAPTLQPPRDLLILRVRQLLEGFRSVGAPIAHIRTHVCADGSDAMPHWRAMGILRCVEGSEGVKSPQEIQEKAGEFIAHKQHFRGFAGYRLDLWLRRHHVDTVVIAGVYSHACVRETVLDAYERGYSVIVAAEGIASDDEAHAVITRHWLEGRAARYQHNEEILTSPALMRPFVHSEH